MGMVEGHGDLDKEEESGWRVRVYKWGWSMAMGPLRRKQILIGRVRVSKL